MRKIFTKIICFSAAMAVATGILLASACSKVYNAKPLSGNNIFTSDAAESNGGFAVEKGDYIYFINGSENSTADNTFGEVVKGAIMRISKADFAARRYSSVDTVVPQIVYSGNSNSGIYIFGDYVYYATPSTEKNSDGEVQNSMLAFKRTKLDGTETMKDYFVQLSNNAAEYRYVEVGGTVYLLYVATSEDYFNTGASYTNIHSVNTTTGTDTLLAYNVVDVTFDKTDVTNPRVFYTMEVTDFVTDTAFGSYYNQVYTVRADATERNVYDFSEVKDYDADTDPLYVNCGTLVFDGIGRIQGLTESVTTFNSKEDGLFDADGKFTVTRNAYKYTVSSYQDGTLFYTRTDSQENTYMFALDEDKIFENGWKPVASNPTYDEYFVLDSSSASSYTYLFEDGKLEGALIAGEDGLIKAGVDASGRLLTETDNVDTFYLTKDGQATVLFTQKHGDNNYIYYSLTGGNGYTVYRVCYDGSYADYNRMPERADVNEYTPVRVLDLDAASDWYMPEMYSGQIMFLSETENMTEYSYVMVCDLRADGGAVMTNVQIDELNERYESVSEAIDEIDEEVYENLKNALKYAYFTCDGEYIKELIKAYKDVLGYDEEHFWSNESLKIYEHFLAATGDFEKFLSAEVPVIEVNGKEVASNKRDYYYTLLGKMSDADAEDYSELLKNTYLQEYPEVDESWFESLSKGAKAGFIIGVCTGGLIVIAAVVVGVLLILRWRRNKRPVYKKKRIKVDTTDDKDIDVYAE